ncbi:unnamed protein product [Spirodela intermedia]|uniref:Uncharacterized protein n=1 Tax=Spirodela intermedia TaxID=51605 RepID=A0A7I8L2X0_SPIIN|nr:unnamed protein product [Spirodela intermedia]
MRTTPSVLGQVMRATEIMRHVTQWLRSTHSLVPNKTKRSRSVCEAFGPGLLSDLLDGHHRGLDSGNSTSTEHLKATQDHLEEAAQEYLGRHHAMSRTHHNYYASIPRRESDRQSSLFGRTCPWKPEVLIDLSDSAYPLYAYTALHYRPLHDSGVLLGGDQGWLLLAAEDHNGDTFIFGLIVMLQHSSILLTNRWIIGENLVNAIRGALLLKLLNDSMKLPDTRPTSIQLLSVG